MSQFMTCYETGTRRPRLIPIGEVARVEPQDPARVISTPTTITLKSGERIHVMEQLTTVCAMAYTPLWRLDA